MSTSATATVRFDLYGPVHKALRHFMTTSLTALGRLDLDDAEETDRVCTQLQCLLETMVSHVAHEDRFIHPLLDSLHPGGAAAAASDHESHGRELRALDEQVAALRQAPSPDAQDRLYHALARFVGEQFVHMEHEEGEHQRLLWQHLSDEQLRALHDRLVASIPPAEFGALLGWMLPSLSPQQRAGMLGEIRDTAPAPVFGAVIGLAQQSLDARAWTKLTRALQIDQPLAA